MVKTAAEYQKAYRERKKARDETFLEKERARAKGYRKPILAKTKKDQALIRERNKQYSQKYRDRQKTLKQTQVRSTTITTEAEEKSEEDEHSNVVSSTSSEPVARAKRGQSTLLVKLSFPQKRRNKRKSDALKRVHSKIQRLNGQISSLTRNKNKWAKRCQRISKKIILSAEADGITTAANNEKSLTPKSKTIVELRRDGVSPRKLPKSVVKKLVLSNAILDEIKSSRRANPQQLRRNIATRVISGKILKKYKCVSMVSKKTGISLTELRRHQDKVIEFRKRSRMKAERDQLKAHVVEFIEQDDVSVMMPGKADAKLYEGEKRQIRILTDYMSNIH
ncbi:uncharacterized protein LOC127850997 [Dreissena polymorpha]|uniref:Uncharacterized protein n=1 Tax=Dreissena polymorpha TaxID=45954 RepID=A0A9D4HVV6_DREPO|nr:uncharacterized protein LOC127850997 [Dreissena polymorpha]KAH3734603.1 hypothetical protein DPMN_041042 [Dreissena polymorpha]